MSVGCTGSISEVVFYLLFEQTDSNINSRRSFQSPVDWWQRQWMKSVLMICNKSNVCLTANQTVVTSSSPEAADGTSADTLFSYRVLNLIDYYVTKYALTCGTLTGSGWHKKNMPTDDHNHRWWLTKQFALRFFCWFSLLFHYLPSIKLSRKPQRQTPSILTFTFFACTMHKTAFSLISPHARRYTLCCTIIKNTSTIYSNFLPLVFWQISRTTIRELRTFAPTQNYRCETFREFHDLVLEVLPTPPRKMPRNSKEYS